jgi:primosomal protein N' (replication factor Y)
MRKRIKNRPLPPVEIVDMRRELKEGNKSIFSRSLYRAMKETLDRGEQVILFLNRRGFSTFVLCRECGLVLKCPQCDISLTFHFDSNVLKCHYCGYFKKTPDVCPNCSSIYIRFFGIGTQKVEQLVKRLFRGASVHRMDVDSTTRKGSHESILNRFSNGDIDVLVGTQMVAKGLDNPRVGLVGVITADTSLNLPDFRAGERTFQLATQVAGRTGRGHRPGRVILQTYNPEHYALKCAAEHNYMAFYKEEINLRKQFQYPPFWSLVNIIFSGSDENNTARRAQAFAQNILGALPRSWALLGPSPAPISKIKGNFRWQIILKGKDVNKIIPLLTSEYFKYKNENDDVKISIDLNPYFML